MKTITLDNGTKVEISNESHQAFIDAVKPEFKAREWVYINDRWSEGKKVLRVKKIDSNFLYLDWDKYPSANQNKKFFRHATPEEIKAHLIEEAEKRGFVEGTNCGDITNIYSNGERAGFYGKVDNDWEYDPLRDSFSNHGCNIYQQGKWAEIIPDTITIKINDSYAAEILDGGSIKVGCQTFCFEELKKVYKAAKAKR